jgi:hypothetical protein
VTFRADIAKSQERKQIATEFIVEVSAKPHKVAVEFATLRDMGFVEKWRETLGTSPEPIQRDAVDLAQLARDRFFADSRVGQPYIAASGDVRDHIGLDPQCEVAGLMLLKCEWFPDSEIIGLCHFRRTWCNNIVLDYLAKHPLTLGDVQDARYKVKGIGPALLCFLSRIAIDHSCDQIWGEATNSSCDFYRRFFELDQVKDLFVIPADNVVKCANRKLDWQTSEDINRMNMEAVEELYEVERAHPPLVGNRSFVVGSRRQLIDHFLDLPRHTQDEIAETLGLLREDDSEILEDQWCGILSQRADQAGKLRELWNEVETQHPNGEPEKNPFIR